MLIANQHLNFLFLQLLEISFEKKKIRMRLVTNLWRADAYTL